MKKILLVNDSQSTLIYMSQMAKRFGYVVQTASHAEQAMEMLQKGCCPDVVITGLKLSGMDGISLIRSMRKLICFFYIPVLILSPKLRGNIRQEASEVWATGWLAEPVNPGRFYDVMKALFPAHVIDVKLHQKVKNTKNKKADTELYQKQWSQFLEMLKAANYAGQSMSDLIVNLECLDEKRFSKTKLNDFSTRF